MTEETWQSDSGVVPAKSPNNAGQPVAEVVEGRHTDQGKHAPAKRAPVTEPEEVLQNALDRVRKAARSDKQARFTSLLHHVSVSRLRKSYFALQRKASAGVDSVTWSDYGESLESNLEDLHGRLHRGGYRAKPSRRVYISKPDGRQRPLGIPALEDKVVQRAVVEVLEAIYEEDFVGFSYGFRRGRSAHDALNSVAVGIQRCKVNWVLDADIRGFFDAIDHTWMIRFIEHRIADRRVVRLIQKWLNAGIMEDGKRVWSKQGTPQGSTVSPLLANVYLHYAFDLWVASWRRHQSHGDMIVVRYADDVILGFEHESDARRFGQDLRERLRKFGLELNAEKTRLLEFGRFAVPSRAARGVGKPETFDFLGFTHICGTSQAGRFLLRRHTSSSRMRGKLKEVKASLMRRRHFPVPEQGRWLGSVLRGYFGYHAVPTNSAALRTFRMESERHWMHSLRRRSQRHRMSWPRLRALAKKCLPDPRIQHAWPDPSLLVNYPR